MIVTISFGMPSRSRIWDDCSRNDHSSAPIAIPTGWLRPSSAMAMPAKPKPAGKSCPYEWLSPSSSASPTRPATAPESSIVRRIIRLTSTPLATAAVSDRPVAFRSKPNRVRPSSSQ